MRNITNRIELLLQSLITLENTFNPKIPTLTPTSTPTPTSLSSKKRKLEDSSSKQPSPPRAQRRITSSSTKPSPPRVQFQTSIPTPTRTPISLRLGKKT